MCFRIHIYIYTNILAIINHGISLKKHHWQRGNSNMRRFQSAALLSTRPSCFFKKGRIKFRNKQLYCLSHSSMFFLTSWQTLILWYKYPSTLHCRSFDVITKYIISIQSWNIIWSYLWTWCFIFWESMIVELLTNNQRRRFESTRCQGVFPNDITWLNIANILITSKWATV